MTGDAKYKKKVKKHTGWIKEVQFFVIEIPERGILGTIKERNK